MIRAIIFSSISFAVFIANMIIVGSFVIVYVRALPERMKEAEDFIKEKSRKKKEKIIDRFYGRICTVVFISTAVSLACSLLDGLSQTKIEFSVFSQIVLYMAVLRIFGWIIFSHYLEEKYNVMVDRGFYTGTDVAIPVFSSVNAIINLQTLATLLAL